MRIFEKGLAVVIGMSVVMMGVMVWGARHGLPHDWSLLGIFLVMGESGARYWRLYYILWAFYWLVGWGSLGRVVNNDDTPKKVFASSLAVFIMAPLAWSQLSHGQGNVWNRLLWRLVSNPGLLLALRKIVALTFPLVMAGSMVAGIALWFGWGGKKPTDEEMGQAPEWPKKVKHERYVKDAARQGLTYIGYEITREEPVMLNALQRNVHVHVVGSTGSGKTRFVLLPMIAQDIAAGRGVVFVDAKASLENAKAVYHLAAQAGRAKDFLFFSLNHLHQDYCSTFNPLQNGNATQLKDKITGSLFWSEPYYQTSSENALQTLFMDLEEQGMRITLPKLASQLQNPKQTLQRFHEFAVKHKEDIKNLTNGIDVLVKTPFAVLLNMTEAEIDLMDVYNNRKIVYFALDAQSYTDTAKRLGKMITQDINTLSGVVASTIPPEKRKPLCIYIDEFQAFGTKAFVNALAQGRDSGFWITIAHQSLGDLRVIDEAYYQQVNDLTNTKIFLRVNDPATAQFFADTVGTHKEKKRTAQIFVEGMDPKNLMGSERVVHEYLIHPSDLKTLQTGQAVFKSIQHYGHLSLQGLFPDVTGIELPKKDRSRLKKEAA